MAVDPKFWEASRKAEQWALLLADYCTYAKEGRVVEAYSILFRLREEWRQHEPILMAAKDMLDAVVDNPISHQGLHGVRYYSNAHAALADIVWYGVFTMVEMARLRGDPLPENWTAIAGEQLAKCWKGVEISYTMMQARIQQERARLLAKAETKPASKGTTGEPQTRRTGRPRKRDSDKQRLVVAALARHHGYQPVGSVSNYNPAKTESLAKGASGKGVEVSVATVSRFFQKKFSGQGYKGYVAACNRDARITIGMYLALWQGEVSDRLPGLLPHETGQGDKDD
jgi:hypothetical protein